MGRFAPSPTGPLHFGSLVAAVGSFLDARSQGGKWLVRMEDIDTPRVRAGAADTILQQLECFGFAWDGPVLYQSGRTEAYRESLRKLREAGLVYPCVCTRKAMESGRYPGTCRNRKIETTEERASWRVRVNDEPVRFTDRLQGAQEERLSETCGDFVVLRADGITAYQLAVVVDDAMRGISDVVRDADLLDSTCRQIYLQSALGLQRPGYLHLPVAVNAAGEKLSKQTRAQAISCRNAGAELWRALAFLGQRPPADLAHASVNTVWQWAFENWDVLRIPATLSATYAE